MPEIIITDDYEEKIEDTKKTEEKDYINIVKKIQDFLKEYNINLSIRLLNTLVRVEDPTQHLINYAHLTGRDYIDLGQKVQSREWKMLEKELKEIETDKQINKRFVLYFGVAGTGKTTTALKETKDVIIMNENVTPKELIFDFTFDEEGNPKFVKNAFAKAMEEGKPIVLDEINLAPFDTIRYLQGVLDNKDEAKFGNTTIKIKEGFKVIGTMNEEVLGMESFLPEPLIDRAMELTNFIISPDRLIELAL